MTYLIPAGIVATYATFWFAMSKPVAKARKRIVTGVRDKVRRRRERKSVKSGSEA
jgi:hypothetical protein